MTPPSNQFTGEESHKMGSPYINPNDLPSMDSPFDSGDDVETGFNELRRDMQEASSETMEQESP